MAYCDDIILLSTSLKTLQILVDKCAEFGLKWNISFNPKKSCIIHAGSKLYKDPQVKIKLYGNDLEIVDKTKYLGLMVSDTMNFSSHIESKLKEVQRTYNSLYQYGTRPYGLNPFTKAHIYKTFCLPKALYGLGVIKVPHHLLKKLEIIQNDVIRSTLGLSKYNHLSEIKEVLGIQTIEHSYLKYKCSLIGLLKRHPLSNSILQLLISENYPDNKLSLRHDLKKIRDITNLSLSEIYSNPNMACEILSQKLKQRSLTSEIRPKIEKISEFLADFTPTNMVKLRELTFVFNATPVE